MNLNSLNPRKEVSTLLPQHIREMLTKASGMVEIDAAHRYARALYPAFFNMEDDSHAVKEPKACDTFGG